MRINSLTLKNFRNIGEMNFTPYEEMNVICGENAQGKTNIIEAIWLFSGAKSFRASKDSTFVKFGEAFAENMLNFSSGGIENTAVMRYEEKRTAFLNEKQLKSPSALAGVFDAVVFSPYDLAIVKDGPNLRRRFVDTAVGQLYPNFIDILRDYTRAVTQRNQIIKDYKYDGSLSVMLDVFEQEIAQKGEKIIEYRRAYIEKIKGFLPEIYNGLSSSKESITAEYVTTNGNLAELIKNSRKSDTYTGVTSVGPHRDDVEFKINGISVRGYGSQGQKRSCALSLKLAQGEIINELKNEYPIILLDDVMSELDPSRQNYILNHIKGRQSFITCCDPSNTAGLKKGKIFGIKEGRIEDCT